MIRNIFAIITGVLVGMTVNMGLIILGGSLIPLSENFDPMNATSWELINFIFPFLAHALGTFSGAYIAAKIATSYQFSLTMSIGEVFLIGGIAKKTF